MASSSLSALEIPFAGRHEEFSALVSEYHATCVGETRMVAVLGEGGLGKTRLAKEFLVWAKARGAEVLEGAALEGARLPYGPLVEAITRAAQSLRALTEKIGDEELREDFLSAPRCAACSGTISQGIGALLLRRRSALRSQPHTTIASYP